MFFPPINIEELVFFAVLLGTIAIILSCIALYNILCGLVRFKSVWGRFQLIGGVLAFLCLWISDLHDVLPWKPLADKTPLMACPLIGVVILLILLILRLTAFKTSAHILPSQKGGRGNISNTDPPQSPASPGQPGEGQE